MSECMPCAKGSHAGEAPGVPGVQAGYLAGLGCTRRLHTDVFPVCALHCAWLVNNYKTLFCGQCMDTDREQFFIDGFIADEIKEG